MCKCDTNIFSNLVIRSRVVFSNIRDHLLAHHDLNIDYIDHDTLHTLIKNMVGKTKAGNLTSRHNMTIISAVSTMTWETDTHNIIYVVTCMYHT